MDTNELIQRCKAITLSGEGEGRVSLRGTLKDEGGKIAAGCLIGKVLTSRNVNKEGLKIALQQAWQNIREVKVENMGENVFMFKFGAEVDKKRVLINGPWHFNNALIVFTEPVGIGDISKQSFTHTSFWVQLQNAPIMCMDKEILTEIGGAIRKVEEVETDANGNVMGQIIRLRVSVDITKPLKKVIMVEPLEEQEDTQGEGQEKMQEDM